MKLSISRHDSTDPTSDNDLGTSPRLVRGGRRVVAVATATSALALALTACGTAPLVPAAGGMAAPTTVISAAVEAVEPPAHRTTMPVAPTPAPAAAASAPTATAAATTVDVPAATPVKPKVASGTKTTPTPSVPAPPKTVKAPAVAAKAAPAAPAAPAVSRPTSYRGVPIVYADPDGYPGAWGTASAQAIWVYPAAPARYVQSVIMHEYMHVLQFRAGWNDVASTHGERVADAGEQLLGGSYFKYTRGSATAAELAEARGLLGR